MTDGDRAETGARASRSRPTRSATSSIPGRCRTRSTRSRSPAPRAATSGTTTGKRYLDFASQLVNVSIGHQHPKLVAAIKEQADTALHDRAADGDRAAVELARLLAEVTPGDISMSVLHQRRRRGERERDQARALVHGPAQDRRALPQLSRRDGRRDHADGRPAPLARRAGHPRRRADVRPVHVPLPGRPSRSVPRVHGRPASRGDPPVRGAGDGRGRDPRAGDRDERRSSSRPTATCSPSARSATATGSC